jgi:hypothetical protein
MKQMSDPQLNRPFNGYHEKNQLGRFNRSKGLQSHFDFNTTTVFKRVEL